MKIGIYVGSFDPVHKAHIDICNYLIDNSYVDKVIIIPTLNYWNKTNITNIDNRIDMLKFYENNNIIINTTLNTFKYTYQILNELKKEKTNDELYLIIGADNIEKFYLWKSVDKILNNKVLILPRNNVDITKYINKYDKKENFIIVEGYKLKDISSTIIREKLKNKDYNNIDKYLDKDVLNYIRENNLYVKRS